MKSLIPFIRQAFSSLRRALCLGIMATFLGLTSSALATTYYVNVNATGALTGLDPADAFTNVIPAAALAVSGDQIQIAAGYYNETNTINLTTNVNISGGWDLTFTTYNPTANATILDGRKSGTNSFLIMQVGGAVTVGGASTNAVSGLTFINGFGSTGGLRSYGTNLLVSQCVFSNCWGTSRGGAIGGDKTFITALNCSFFNNQTPGGGRGTIIGAQSSGASGFFVNGCVAVGNYSTNGMFTFDNSGALGPAIVWNSLFVMNTNASLGKDNFFGFDQGGSAMNCEIANCTFVSNSMVTATTYGNLADFPNSSGIFANNILVGNSSLSGSYVLGAPTVENNLIYQNTGLSGITAGANGNIQQNPVFNNPAAGDYSLACTSPAIDAGTDLSGIGLISDIIGISRPQGPAYDIGAYEFVGSPCPVFPFIYGQPQPVTVYVGFPFSLTVNVSGTHLICQWETNGIPITGANNFTYSVASASLSDAGNYTAVITNVLGSTNSAVATVTVLQFTNNPSFVGDNGAIDPNGDTVVIEAENFDANTVTANGGWMFENAIPGYSGTGYMRSLGAGGDSLGTNPHLDYYVTFNNSGYYYLWVLGSDAGANALDVGLDGYVASQTTGVGGLSGTPGFGTRYASQWNWVNFYAGNSSTYARINVPAPGTYFVSLFVNGEGMLVDKILLTSDAFYVPNGTGPSETLNPTNTTLAVTLTQPLNGQTLYTRDAQPVAAKVTGNNIQQVEFFDGATPIGVVTNAPYAIQWANFANGSHSLMAQVTTVSSSIANSSVAGITMSNAYLSLPVLGVVSNTFDNNLGPFNYVSLTNGNSFGWTNSATAGGAPGELGATICESAAAAYAADLFSGGATLSSTNEIVASGQIWASSWNGQTGVSGPTNWYQGDFYLGYLNTLNPGNNTAPSRLGLRFNNPQSANPTNGPWRIYLANAAGAGNNMMSVTQGVAQPFLFVWQPSPFVDTNNNSGYMMTLQVGIQRAVTTYTASLAGVVNYNAFGLQELSNSSGTNNVGQAFIDNLAYSAPALLRTASSGNQVIVGWDVNGFTLQWGTNLTSGAWVNYPGLVTATNDSFSATTNDVADPARFFRLVK